MMMTSPSIKILGALVAATLLSACGGAISPSGTAANIPQSRVPEASMISNAKGSLAYVSDASSSVYIYSYPQLQSVGKLTGFAQPLGLCVDAAGDVWVADYGVQKMEEFAHGASKPKATLKLDDFQSPYACSVDRKTGDLAVAAWRGNVGPGYVSIFKKAKGTAKTLTDSAFFYMDGIAYDSKGNLFIDGQKGNKSCTRSFHPVPRSSLKFRSRSTSSSPEAFSTTAKNIAVGDAEGAKIYETSGKNVQEPPRSPVPAPSTDSSLTGSVICASGEAIQIYKYPAGGAATLSIAASGATSVVVSK